MVHSGDKTGVQESLVTVTVMAALSAPVVKCSVSCSLLEYSYGFSKPAVR